MRLRGGYTAVTLSSAEQGGEEKALLTYAALSSHSRLSPSTDGMDLLELPELRVAKERHSLHTRRTTVISTPSTDRVPYTSWV
jgi:hypothetical protein